MLYAGFITHGNREAKQMKIIIVTGKSGSGKSTLCTIMANEIKAAKHIDVDYLIKEQSFFKCNKKKVWQKFSKETYLAGDLVAYEVKRAAAFIRSIFEPTSILLEQKIDQSRQDGCTCLIINWAFIQNLPMVDKANLRVFVSCDEQKRREYLQKRLDENTKMSGDEGLAVNLRDLIYMEVNNIPAFNDHTIFNDYHPGTLLKEAKKIAKEIM